MAGDHDKITAMINLLTNEFTSSPQANHRKVFAHMRLAIVIPKVDRLSSRRRVFLYPLPPLAVLAHRQALPTHHCLLPPPPLPSPVTALSPNRALVHPCTKKTTSAIPALRDCLCRSDSDLRRAFPPPGTRSHCPAPDPTARHKHFRLLPLRTLAARPRSASRCHQIRQPLATDARHPPGPPPQTRALHSRSSAPTRCPPLQIPPLPPSHCHRSRHPRCCLSAPHPLLPLHHTPPPLAVLTTAAPAAPSARSAARQIRASPAGSAIPARSAARHQIPRPPAPHLLLPPPHLHLRLPLQPPLRVHMPQPPSAHVAARVDVVGLPLSRLSRAKWTFIPGVSIAA
ncbi:hypothetical protein Syun_021650 [Stephania yunnanensis]|uniref:Uncharacterized protein n=1 Tax=Stephania yunnanensis TaxID=152371 RepID=A0AAP0IG53_9MAGN